MSELEDLLDRVYVIGPNNPNDEEILADMIEIIKTGIKNPEYGFYKT